MLKIFDYFDFLWTHTNKWSE